MLLGTDISAVLATLEALDVDVIGLNCSTGPEDMRDAIRFLGEHSPAAGPLHPQRRPAAPGPERRDDLPRAARAARRGARRVRRALRRLDRRRLLRHDARRTSPRSPSAAPGAPRASGPSAGPTLLSSMMTATPLVQDPRPTLVGERVNSPGLAQGQGAAAGRRLRRARRRSPRTRSTGGAHVLDVCVALTERQDEDEQMRQVVKRISLTQPAPIQVDSTEPEVIETALEQIPGPRDRQLDQPRGRPRQARPRRPDRQGPRRGADRADDRRGRDGQDGRAQARDRPADHRAVLRRARPRPRGADLRLPDVHADDRRRRVEAERGRDDRGDPAGQGRDPRASRPRSASPTSPSASGCRRAACSTACSCTTASRPGSTWRWSTRTTSRRTRRSRARSASSPTTSCSTAARTRSSGSSPTSSPRARRRTRAPAGRPDRGDGARGGAPLPHPAPQEGGRRGLDRPERREDRRGPDAQRRCCCRR